jgi:hypothetical protein
MREPRIGDVWKWTSIWSGDYLIQMIIEVKENAIIMETLNSSFVGIVERPNKVDRLYFEHSDDWSFEPILSSPLYKAVEGIE